MPLNRRQQNIANLIMRIGAKRGVPQNRLSELVYASYKESCLNPQSVNKSSGAAGLYQLLSQGYRDRAQRLGGIHNPRANLLAILPNYLSYWKEHPGAAPGAAARDVERSGMGADWYAPPKEFTSTLGAPSPSRVVNNADIDPVGLPSMDRNKFVQAVLDMAQNTRETGRVDTTDVLGAYRDMHAEFQAKMAETAGQYGSPGMGVGGPYAGGSADNILSTAPPTHSEFATVDAEGAPGPGGKRYHAALDWFGKAGSPVRSPIDGVVVEVKQSQGNAGQVFGGTVKVQGANGRVWVFRHVDPRHIKQGQRIRSGQVVAGITDWQSGSDHLHLELWKTLQGGYNRNNMLDPLKFL